MQKLLILLIVLTSATACAQTGGFGFRRVQTKTDLDAIVVSNTNTSASRRGYVHATGLYYIWNGSVWIEEREVVKILGSIPPAYTPTTEQAYTAINDDGDLFVWDGSVWVLKGNGIYGGSGEVPPNTIATIDNGMTFQSDTSTGEFVVDMDQGLGGTYLRQTPDTIYAEYYDLAGTNSITIDDGGILFKTETPDKVFVDGILQLQDLTTALLTDSASFIVGADSTGNTSRIKIGTNLSLDGDTLNASVSVTNFGSGVTNELAIWSADTLKGDTRLQLVTDTLRTPRHITYVKTGTIDPVFESTIYRASKESLLDPESPFGYVWARDEGDGDWIFAASLNGGGLNIQEVDGGFSGNPRVTLMSARTNASLIPQPNVIGDRVGSIRMIKHKGLSTSRDIYANGAGFVPLIADIDTIYANGNIGFRVGLGGGDNVSGPIGSASYDIRIGRTGDLRFRTYANTRNDPTPIANILYTNNLGDLRSSPIADLIALLPGGGADLTIEGAGPTYSIASSSGTDVTIAGSGITLTESPANTLVFTAADASATNELQVYGHAGTTTYTNTLSNGGGAFSITGAGIAVISQTAGAVTVTATEVDGSITNEIQNLGYTAATGDLTISSGTGTTIPVMTSSVRGLTPDGDGAGTDEFLREDGTWAVPPGGGGNGIYGGSGTIFTNAVAALPSNGTFTIDYSDGSDAILVDDQLGNTLYINSQSGNGSIYMTDNNIVIGTSTGANYGNINIDPTDIAIKSRVVSINPQSVGSPDAPEFRILEAGTNGTNYTAFKNGALASSLTYTLPLTDGVDGEYLKFTTGGQLDWVTPPAGGSPAGANYQLQYYDTGNFGAEAELNYNPTNNQLVVGHTTPGATIHGRYHAYNGGSVFRFETKSGSDILNLFENGYLKFGNGETYPRFYQSKTSGGVVDSLSSGIVADVSIASNTGNEDMFSINHPAISPTAGDKSALKVKGTFEPTSGSANWVGVDVAPTINQTGTSSGVAYGVRVVPTLTDHTQFYGLLLNYNPANDGYGVYQSGANVNNYFSGKTGFGPLNTGPTNSVDIDGPNGYSQLILRDAYTPTSSADTNGEIGQMAWDDNYVYVKTSTGWKRSALSSF